ncbi:TPA: BsuBI/PstI family type II restriction endonuclease [Vibrio parahaemolyticus]
MATIEEKMNDRRLQAEASGTEVVPEYYNGIGKDKIRSILSHIDRGDSDFVDTVFALLCDEQSWFSVPAKQGYLFSDGSNPAYVGTHVNILQRKKFSKVDRENVRDERLVPLCAAGVTERVQFDKDKKVFVKGHPVANSNYSSYRLTEEFLALLKTNELDLHYAVKAWVDSDARRERLSVQAKTAEKSRAKLNNSNEHSVLIDAIKTIYAKRFLDSFDLVFIDNGNGKRFTDEDETLLQELDIEFGRGDRLPDVLFFDRYSRRAWIVDAVVSDGEVDFIRKGDFLDFASRNDISEIGFTTVYRTWKKAASRQGKMKNLAENTYIWIMEDPSRHIKIEQ